MIRITCLTGTQIEPYITDLASLRITVFHDYPYLYEGDFEYEKKYLKTFLHSKNNFLVLVFDDNKVVGASTALPVSEETENVKQPLIDAGYDVNKIFLLSESVLLPAYRGQQIGKRFFAERESAAKKYGYTIAAFCAVKRAENHPLKPKNWHPLDPFWQKLGYTKHPEIVTHFSWKDIGDKDETIKPLTFWLKNL